MRKLLAQYGTDKVRVALLAQGEADPEVLVEIAKWGSVQVKNRILPLIWDRPEVLQKIAPFLGSRGLRILEKHPDQDVQFCAALYGSREKCKRFLDAVKGKKDPNSWIRGELLSTRLEELEQVHGTVQECFGELRPSVLCLHLQEPCGKPSPLPEKEPARNASAGHIVGNAAG